MSSPGTSLTPVPGFSLILEFLGSAHTSAALFCFHATKIKAHGLPLGGWSRLPGGEVTSGRRPPPERGLVAVRIAAVAPGLTDKPKSGSDGRLGGIFDHAPGSELWLDDYR